MLNNLLFYRLLITNGFALALFVWAYSLGYVQKVLERDVSNISEVIFGLFVIGLISTFIRGYKVSEALNHFKKTHYKSKSLTTKYRKMPAKNTHIYRIAEFLAILGLVGNALGFFIALDHAGVGGSNQQIADSLLAGMGVAFGSTLVGSITGLLTLINYGMIETATSMLIEDTK